MENGSAAMGNSMAASQKIRATRPEESETESQTRVHTIVPTALFTTAKGGSGRTHPRGAMGRPAVHLTMAHGPG